MQTMELKNVENGAGGIGAGALVMAVGIIVDQISRLPEKDRQDFYALLQELRHAQTQEEIQALRLAMVEILEQEPLRLATMDLGAPPPRSVKLNRWVAFVSGKIRTLRQHKHMTQQQLARKTGLPQSHISRLEAGQHSPSRTTLEKLAAALKVPLGDLDPSAN